VFSYYRRGRLADTAAALEQPPSPLASQDPGSRIRQAGAGSEEGRRRRRRRRRREMRRRRG